MYKGDLQHSVLVQGIVVAEHRNYSHSVHMISDGFRVWYTLIYPASSRGLLELFDQVEEWQ